MKQTSQRIGDEYRTEVSGITIDSETTLDRDDAIHIERKGDQTRISVHIADAPHYIPKDSEIDKNAFKQGETIYLPGECNNKHMLGQAMAENKISLLEGEKRRTISFIMDLNEFLDFENIEIKETWLNCERNMSYNEVEHAVQNGSKMMRFWCATAQALYTKRRHRAGKFLFNEAENIYYDENGKPLALMDGVKKSYMLIEETMLLAGQAMAQYAEENNISIPFRNHRYKTYQDDDLDSQVLLSYPGGINYNWVEDDLNGLDFNAFYSEEAEGHEGLGLARYTHCTSPIRRYPDMIVLRQMKTYLHNLRNPEDKVPYPYNVKDIKKKTKSLNKTLRDNKYRIAKEAHVYFNEYNQNLLLKSTEKEDFQDLNIGNIHSLLTISLKENIKNPGFRESLENQLKQTDLPIKFLNTLVHGLPRKDDFWQPIVRATYLHFKKQPNAAINLIKLSEVERKNWKVNFSERQKDDRFAHHLVLDTDNKKLSSPRIYLIPDRKDAKKIAAVRFLYDYMKGDLVNSDDTIMVYTPRCNEGDTKEIPLYTFYGEKADLFLQKIATEMRLPLEYDLSKHPEKGYRASYFIRKSENSMIYASGHAGTKTMARRIASFNFINALKEQKVLTNHDIQSFSDNHKEFVSLAQRLSEKQGWIIKENRKIIPTHNPREALTV